MAQSRQEKEQIFHDEWASSMTVDEVSVRAAFEAPTAPENRYILRQMGDLRGRRILDIGCGLGESSIYFALQGAQVTAVDISPKMIELAQRLAGQYGVRIKTAVSDAESLGVEPGAFDFVFLGNLLHHVSDREHLLRQVNLALRPGGRFFSWDPLAYNPVINLYRRLATKVRTEDETPLTKADLAVASRIFHRVGHREFWYLGLGIFLKYFLIDRVHPNADRYWKRILTERPTTMRCMRLLMAVDHLIGFIPGIHWWGWNMVMWGEKAAEGAVARINIAGGKP